MPLPLAARQLLSASSPDTSKLQALPYRRGSQRARARKCLIEPRLAGDDVIENQQCRYQIARSAAPVLIAEIRE